MSETLKLCIFGDQTCDLKPHWKELFHLRSNPSVEDFLVKAYDAVRREIWKLPVDARGSIPRFTSINDLILSNQDGDKRCLAIDTAVSCIYELATFISQADAWYHDGGKTIALGLCLGGLPSAAVCTSRTTHELIPRAVEAVKAAFRTGLQASEMAKRLVPRTAQDEFEGSWSILCSGSDASIEALSKYCERTGLPSTARPYISAFSPNAVTVSGSPSSLAKLVESPEFKGIRSKKLPVHGPLHAPHLYTKADIDEIVEGLGLDCGIERSDHLPFLSSTGVMIKGPNFASLLRSAVDAIAAQPMRFPELLDQLQSHIQEVDPKSFDMIPIATTVDRLVYNTFKTTPLASLVLPPPAPGTQKSNAPEIPPPNPKTPKLAIIGMSGRFPGGANSVEAFWDILYQGLDVHKSVPPRRWDVNTHIDPTLKKKNTGAVPWGCWIDDAALFDARFFNISPREAPQIDPAQRLALMTVYEAIEQSGIVVDTTPSMRPDRVGVFYGVTANDWAETNSTQDIDTYLIPGGNRAFIPGRINYFYNLSGPSYAIDTACSSALAAIHIACNALWRGDIDTAIAGGTNIMTNPDPHAGLDRGHFLSRTGNCKTFDDGADGYCRGEGVGTLIIKRLDDAIADNDPILAVILDTYTNHSSESESITRPHAGAQRAVFNKIMNQGNMDPYSVSYVEMHGTGTQVGDATEMSSVLSTFAPPLSQVARGRSKDESLYLGSAKANIGHGEASSGSSALIKVLLMMQKNLIPPHCGIKTKINRKFPTDLGERNVHIAMKPTPWVRSSDPLKPRRAIVNNFGAAGGNTGILLEDAPFKIESNEVDPRNVHLVGVSARSGNSIQGNLRSLLNYLKQNPNVSLGELSYTTTARRMHHQHRVMLSGSAVGDFCKQIETALENKMGMTRPKSAPKFIFTFTGQGAQYPGMSKELFTHVAFYRKEILRLDQLSQSLGFPSFLPVIEAEEDQDINAFPPVTVQLANTCIQIALGKLWESWNIIPMAVVGHSLGEYAALNYASVLSDADTLWLVGKRAELLQDKCTRGTHAMLVIRGSVEEISTALGEAVRTVEFACINSPVETVLAGTKEAISEVTEILTKAGRKTTLLSVPYAFHSSQLDPILDDLKDIAESVTFCKPKLPVLCPLNGSIVENEDTFTPEYIVRHSREPVNMIQALLAARSGKLVTDVSMTLEIGPHPAMGGMVRNVLGSQVPTLASSQRGRSAWSVLATTLKSMYMAGADLRWTAFHEGFKASHNVLSLPTYSWDLKDFWMTYVNDWSLRKGDPPLIINGGGPRLETTTIHKVVEETENGDKLKVVTESDITRPDLSPLVQGHEVDGIPLCTPSVWADIALSLGTYFLQRYRPGQVKSIVDVSDMTILKALILRADAKEQLIQIHSEVDWKSNSAHIKFMSFDKKQKLQEHAWCRLAFKDGSLQQKLQKEVPALKQKFQVLKNGVVTGATTRYTGAMCYRAIRPLAKFHPDYKAAGEVILNSDTLEAVSRLSFANIKRDGTYHTHPGVIDALSQSCGFIMNCNDYADLDGDVYMNHGWSSLQLFEPISFDQEYTTYTQMKEGEDSLWHGDVTVLDNKDKVVAYIGHVAIQQVARRVLRVILSIESGTASKVQKQIPARQAEDRVPSLAPKSKVATPKPATVTRAPITASKPKIQETITVPKTSQIGLIAKIMAIIAEESGIAEVDLTDSTAFADIGVDSLLGLTISSRVKEELEQDMDFNALLFECPTVGELKASFGDNGVSGATISSNDQTVNTSEPVVLSEPVAIAPSGGLSPSNDFVNKIMAVIAEESGIAESDLTDSTAFADIGVDSLLGLTISSRVKEELEQEMDFNALLFECPTVGEIKAHFGGGIDAEGFSSASPVLTPGAASTPDTASLAAPSDISSPPSTIGDPIETRKEIALSSSSGGFDFTRALQIIAEESGVALEDFTPDTAFADAGIDSLLSLTIIARFKDELELEIEHESLLMEFPTVGQLQVALVGETSAEESGPSSQPAQNYNKTITNENPMQQHQSPAEIAALAAREVAVDKFVAKYTAGYTGPATGSATLPEPRDDEKVVVITGASGSLGSHLTWHIVQMPDVKQVICINRPHRIEPYQRQIKAMRDKGIRFPDALKHKLVVLQTDTAKSSLGLDSEEYQGLLNTATHLIHNAWPMSGKRALEGFESQFKVMRNLVDFASGVASLRPQSFKFSFQMVSSIGVVGLYGKQNGNPLQKVLVPEERFGINCILQNGYGDAKWGCERMIDETLHQHDGRFRAMVVRLGQIAGSKTSGYWNPMEHFGFVVKSSQTLDALPDVPGGTLYWTPVNDMADTLADLVLSDVTPYRFYHLENPVGQPWKEMNKILADAVGIKNIIPFEEWVKRVGAASSRNNPAATLLEFLDENYLRMSYGGLVLDPKHTLEHSKSLRAVGPVSEEVARKYIHIWKEIGFLS